MKIDNPPSQKTEKKINPEKKFVKSFMTAGRHNEVLAC